MPSITWASFFAFISSAISAVFTTIVSTLKASYEASHKWFAIGCVVFLGALWLGYVALPKVNAKDADLEKQVASLSASLDEISLKLDKVSVSLDTLKDIGPAKVPGKKKLK